MSSTPAADADVGGVDAPASSADAPVSSVDAPTMSDLAVDVCGAPDDPRNCGACGNDCFALPHVRAGAAAVACVQGQCVIPPAACEAGWAHCWGAVELGCETPVLRPEACGACETRCRGEQVCVQASADPFTTRCELQCQGAKPDACGESCTNFKTDPQNCGACGKVCTVSHGEARCVNGECEVATCRAGFGDCTAEPGCETALQMNHSNCGACGNSCTVLNGNSTCVAGACGPVTCQSGFADCDKTRPDCESPLNSDLNCGACGQRCTGQTPFCLTYQGKQSCLPGCLAPAPDRCGSICVDHQTDPFNCGGCGNACSYLHAAASCQAGSCRMGACQPGYADCNKDPADGCETALDTNRDCGACGNSCAVLNASSLCMAGTCSPATCLPGWADCDKSAPGCETSLGSFNHCGACGNVCVGNAPLCSVAAGTAQCVAGCPALMPVRCDNSCVDITSDPKHCGGCNTSCADAFPNASSFCSGGKCQMGDCLPGFVKEAGKCVACTHRKTMVCGRGTSGILCAVSDGQGAFSTPAWWDLRLSDNEGWSWSPSYYGTIQFPDVTGDGRSDVCGRFFAGVMCAPAEGSGFPDLRWWDFSHADWYGWHADRHYWDTISFPDVNGDGKADLCSRGGPGIWCAPAGPTSFGIADLWSNTFGDDTGWSAHPSRWGTIQFPDLNGDGKSDVCGRNETGIRCALVGPKAFAASTVWQPSFGDGSGWEASPDRWATIQFPDITGDGKADLCGRSPEGIACAVGDGTNFGPLTTWAAAFKDARFATRTDLWSTIQFPDLNGDGKADVCGRDTDGLHCGLSTGSSFEAVTLWLPDFSDDKGWNQQPQAGTIQFADLDDDGKDDVCGRGAPGITCAISNGSTAFTGAKLWVANYSDEFGWSSGPEYWSTISIATAEAGNCRPPPRRSSFPRRAARIPF